MGLTLCSLRCLLCSSARARQENYRLEVQVWKVSPHPGLSPRSWFFQVSSSTIALSAVPESGSCACMHAPSDKSFQSKVPLSVQGQSQPRTKLRCLCCCLYSSYNDRSRYTREMASCQPRLYHRFVIKYHILLSSSTGELLVPDPALGSYD